MRLKDKVAVVVGSTYGIGKSIACLFAKEGAKVVVSGRTVQKGGQVVEEIVSGGGDAIFIHCDVLEAAEIEALMNGTVKHFGRVDVLVNNAFALNPLKPMAEITFEDWQRVVNVILNGTFLGCKYAIPHMISSGGGSIINIGSVGSMLGFRLHSAYNAAKAGVANMTRAMALDYGTHNIRANVICPGIIETPHTQSELSDPKVIDSFMSKLAIKRIGRGEDIAKAAVYFASDESSYVTGTVFPVDGGWTAMGNNDEDVYEF